MEGSSELPTSSVAEKSSFIPRKTAPDGKEVIDAGQLADLIIRTKPDIVDQVLNSFFQFYEECLLMDNVEASELNQFPLDLIQVGQAYFALSVKSIGGWIDAFSCLQKYKTAKVKKPEPEEQKQTDSSSQDTTP